MNTPAQQRRDRIEALVVEAERLLASANHESIKEQVQLASRNLAEASTWVRQGNFDSRPSIMRIVDRILDLAETRLRLVDEALTAHGSDAKWVG